MHAQKPVTDTYTDVSSIKLVRPLSKLVSTCFVPDEKDPIRDYKSLKFEDDIIYHGPVPGNILQKTLLLRFNITNSRDTAIKILYFPGYFYTDIELYRVNGDTLIPQKTTRPAGPNGFSFREFSVEPHDSLTIVAKSVFAKTYLNTIRPRLVAAGEIDAFIAVAKTIHTKIHLFTYIFCGLLLMMILFSLSNYLQGGNRGFLYYALYALFMGVMLFSKVYFEFRVTSISLFLESFLDFILQSLELSFT
ncbi:MAG: hypothetical protein IPM85_16165 [Chitinophagaceae bacterium]|nr:hypothetical protein [Chitinophagaceae bacterium]